LPLSAGNYSKTPSPNEFVGKKGGSKPSDKKRQKAAMNLSQFAAFCHFRFNAAKHHSTRFNISGSSRWNRPAKSHQDKRKGAAKIGN